ncbi:MAG: SDR family oxidoreductase [Candidatus Omnitrophota bacterium]
MSSYLVTGGAGFIGSNIAEQLAEKGNKVIIIDNLESGKLENIETFKDTVEFVKGDIRDRKLLDKILPGVEYISHQAALRSVPKSLDNPQSYNEVNIAGTLTLLEAARDARVKRVVFASSSSIYGDTEILPQTEDILPKLISPYALSKLAGEYYCRIFTKNFGMETVSLRYFNVFGPRQSLENEYAVVIPKFITCMLRDESPPVHGDGLQSRDFSYIDNVVLANILACKANNVAGEVFNIACNERHTVLDIIKVTNMILGKDINPIHEPPRKGDVRHTEADISKAKKLLNYKPSVGFEEGIKKTIEYFKQCL